MKDKTGFWFKCKCKGTDDTEITYYINNLEITHGKLVEHFSDFMKACGYSINGDYVLEENDNERHGN